MAVGTVTLIEIIRIVFLALLSTLMMLTGISA